VSALDSSILRSTNYISRFGLWSGLKLLLQIERQLERRSEVLRQYRVPGYEAPIWLRETVADHSFFWQCIVATQYAIERFPQTARLQEEYESILSRRDRPVILDAGGNIGLAAIWLARAFPKAVVVSIEPERHNFALLTRNVAPFGQQIISVLGAVAERAKCMTIANPDAGSGAFRVEECSSPGSQDVIGYPVCDLVAMVPNGVLFIAKLDIEGSQKDVFTRNIAWVSDVRLIILELEDWQFPWQATSEAFFKAVSKHRFDYLIGGENLFCFRHLPA
jgi:FkbM family methyltransferase